ncbi:MAG: DMT family transporter [Notoacmeibacter sp.]
MSIQDWGLLFLLSVLWGGSFFFATIAVREIQPFTLVLLRTGIAALALLVILGFRREKMPFVRGAIAAFFIMGFLNNLIPFTLLFWAQTKIPSGLASIFNATTPIFSIIVGHFALSDEKMAAHKAIGIAFGFLGVVVLLGVDFFNGANIAIIGMLACLGAATSYGFASVFGRRFKTMGFLPTQVALGQLSATTIMMLPLVAAFDQPWALPLPGFTSMSAVFALALLSTALAYVIFFRVLASAGATNVSLVTLLIPVSAILLGSLILGEELALRHYAGMALIATGLLAIDGRLLAHRKI